MPGIRGGPHPRRIIAAAILHDGKVYSLPAPARHFHVMQDMLKQGVKPPFNGEQGFKLADGTFIRRKPALHHALAIRQLDRAPPSGVLTSEDLW